MTAAIAPPRSPAGHCEYHFLDPCLGEIFHLFHIDMRDVGQFVGRNDATDNGRAFGPERVVDGRAQLAGLFRLEPYPAAGGRSGLGKSMAFQAGSPIDSASSLISPRDELL